MKKALVVAGTASMIYQFNIPNIKLLQQLGYQVDVACNFVRDYTCTSERVEELKKELKAMGVNYYHIDFTRNILKVKDIIKAFKQLKKLVKENGYEFAHCHTPMGGVITRTVKIFTHLKVIYTAHGFHFYKGAPKFFWAVYYPIEKFLGHFTDILITINREDYDAARKRIKAKKIRYIPGVGIDMTKFKRGQGNRDELRKDLGIPDDKIWVLNIGELIERKNQERLVEAVANIPDVYLTIAGKGPRDERIKTLASSLGVEDRVKLLGFRYDVSELCACADIFALPSLQEGLSMALMEAMASGKPCVVSRIRGNVDLLDEQGGALFNPYDVDDIKNKLESVIRSDWKLLGDHNTEKVKQFDLNRVTDMMREIYREIE